MSSRPAMVRLRSGRRAGPTAQMAQMHQEPMHQAQMYQAQMHQEPIRYVCTQAPGPLAPAQARAQAPCPPVRFRAAGRAGVNSPPARPGVRNVPPVVTEVGQTSRRHRTARFLRARVMLFSESES